MSTQIQNPETLRNPNDELLDIESIAHEMAAGIEANFGDYLRRLSPTFMAYFLAGNANISTQVHKLAHSKVCELLGLPDVILDNLTREPIEEKLIATIGLGTEHMTEVPLTRIIDPLGDSYQILLVGTTLADQA